MKSAKGTEPSMDDETAHQFEKFSTLGDPSRINTFLKNLEQKIKANPNDIKLKWFQVELYRKSGQLYKAKQLYQMLLKQDKNKQAAYLDDHAVIPYGLKDPEGYSVAPVFLQDDFLDDDSVAMILDYAINNEARFSWANIGYKSPKYDPSARKTLKLWDIQECRTLLEEKLTECFPLVCSALGIPCFEIKKMEMKMTNHLNHFYFHVHADNHKKPTNSNGRIITWLYYFHQQPKAFQGGDLLVFDSNFEEGSFSEAAFSKIAPKHNRLVAMPSHYYHTVTPTHLSSDNFAEGRFAISCHTHIQTNEAN